MRKYNEEQIEQNLREIHNVSLAQSFRSLSSILYVVDMFFDNFITPGTCIRDDVCVASIDEMYEYFQDHSIWYRLDPDIVYDEPVESEEMEPEESVELAPTETTEGD